MSAILVQYCFSRVLLVLLNACLVTVGMMGNLFNCSFVLLVILVSLFLSGI